MSSNFSLAFKFPLASTLTLTKVGSPSTKKVEPAPCLLAEEKLYKQAGLQKIKLE